MLYKNVKRLLFPLIKSGHEWQNISLNGIEEKPKYYFSNVQWILILTSVIVLIKLTSGISRDIIGYIMSAFAISVSLFMSLLISIFDKFEKTNFNASNKTEEEIARLKQKKNFFKRFISITSYLVVLSIFIIVLCSFTYLFNISNSINISDFTIELSNISWFLTIKNILILLYRIGLNYFLLNYLFLTFFITSSSFEYYMSEMNSIKIK